MKRNIAIILLIMSVMMLSACGGANPAKVSISNIETAALEANPDYGVMSFDFASEDGATYSGKVSGVGNLDGMSDEQKTEIANNLGGYFAAGAGTQIDGQLIDAEKYAGKDSSSRSTGKPYGDANICWAASVADMLVSTGWADDNEDAIMTEFTENYFDDGSFQDTGIKYYFNGVNPDQACEEKAGNDGSRDAVFVENEEGNTDFFTSTQVRHPGKDGDKIVNSGHHNDVAAETVYTKQYASDEPTDNMAKTIIDAVDNGDAVGIQLLFYKGESRVGVHAITINGYIKDAEGKLCALIVADSDNDVDWGKTYLDSAEETLAERQSKPNTYNMYLTGEFTHGDTNYISLQDYKYSNSKLKYTDSVIHGITVLKSKTNVGTISESGNGDAVNAQDAIVGTAEFSELDVNFEVKANEKVKVPFIIYNTSYKGYSTNDKPYAKCRYIIFKNGEKYDTVDFDVKFVTDEYATGEANCGFSVNNPYTFKEPGEYQIDVQLDGVYSGKDNHKLAEAFAGNNYLKKAGTVIVK